MTRFKNALVALTAALIFVATSITMLMSLGMIALHAIPTWIGIVMIVWGGLNLLSFGRLWVRYMKAFLFVQECSDEELDQIETLADAVRIANQPTVAIDVKDDLKTEMR